MKLQTKIKIINVISIFLAVLLIVAVATLISTKKSCSEFTPYVIYHDSTELVQIKIGEKLHFSKANMYFEEVANEFKDEFKVHSQNATYLDSVINDYQSTTNQSLYIDEDGYIVGVKQGVYKLEYVFSTVSPKSNKDKSITHTFTALVCVYEGDESKFEPFPERADDFSSSSITTNYIFTKNVTWNNNVKIDSFSGTIINPNGYTLTMNLNGYGYDYLNPYGYVFNKNYGYIDGLKVRYVGYEFLPLKNQFLGIVDCNLGVIKNCEIEGTIYVENKSNTYTFNKDGFNFNNEVRLTVYSDGKILPYYSSDFDRTNFAQKHWYSENNRVYLQSYYLTDDVKARSRVVPTIYESKTNSNTCEHLYFGKQGEVSKKVTLKIPIQAEKPGVLNYDVKEWRQQVNDPLEIPNYRWKQIKYYEEGQEDLYKNLEVEYWLINGEKVDNLNDVVITEDLVIEPCVKYTRSKFYNEKIFNTSEILYTSDVVKDSKPMGIDVIGEIFADPRNVYPTQINIDENFNLSKSVQSEKEKYILFLSDYLKNGGKLTVSSKNYYVSFVSNKYFCDNSGKKLYYYLGNESEICLDSQIEEITNGNTFYTGENLVTLDVNNLVSIKENNASYLPNLQEIQFGSSFRIVLIDSLKTVNIWQFLSKLQNLKSISIDETNETFATKDNYVWSKKNSMLLYAPRDLTGEVEILPEIKSTGYGCFNGSDISHLILPESFENLDESSLINMQKLEKITFKSSKQINVDSSTGYTNLVELPALKELVFEGVRFLYFNRNSFSNAKIDIISLPDNLEKVLALTAYCSKYEVPLNNENYYTDEGVLYEYENQSIVQYPKFKTCSSYEVLSDTAFVYSYAFYKSELEQVILPKTCTTINSSAFEESNISKIVINATEDVTIDTDAFYNCKNLKLVEVNADANLKIGEIAFANCKSLKQFPCENVVSLGREAFRGSDIEYFEIGGKISNLGTSVFENSKLKTLVIQDDYNGNVLPSEFCANTPLQNITLGPVTMIESYAFLECSNLKFIDLSNVTDIGSYAFSLCESLQNIDLSNVTVIGSYAFSHCNSLQNIDLSKIDTINEGTFWNCKNLQTVKFAEKVSVGDFAFMWCEKLLNMPNEIISIGKQTFSGCKSIKTANLKVDIASFDLDTFEDCVYLEEVTLTGNNLKFDNVFKNCNSLKIIRITETEAISKSVLISTFEYFTQEVSVYLNVNQNFEYEGKIPLNVTLYVPFDLVEKFKTDWNLQDVQIVGYDFSQEEN